MIQLILPAIFVFLIIGIAYFVYTQKDSEKETQQNNSKFLVPKKGGVLQNMAQDKDGNIKLPLQKRIKISDDTYIFRFSFPNENDVFGLPIGMHVVFNEILISKDEPKGEIVSRKYTPISKITQKGYIDFLIKIYRAGVHPNFPEGGLMTQFIEKLELGQYIHFEGPKGRLQYQGFGQFLISKKLIENKVKIGCIAGGTGITPCYQVIQSVLDNKDDKSQLSLIFGNRTTKDILLKEELQEMRENNKEQFNLYFTVDVKPDAQENWQQGVGFITKDMLTQIMPKPSEETIILYCGPPLFEKLVKTHLTDLGYSESMIFKF